MRLVPLSLDTMVALLDGDLAGAGARAGLPLTDFFVSHHAVWLWRIRVEQIRRDPTSAGWVAGAAVDDDAGVVGLAGFHGPPDQDGMVEVGYSVDPRHRRRGHGGRMLAALVERARRERGVRIVRASVQPGNAASLAMVAAAGFHRVGEQWDEDDGLELVFELAVGGAAGA